MNHREGLFYSFNVLMYLLHRFTAPSDLIFDSYAGLYGCNDRVVITESKFIPCTYQNTHTYLLSDRSLKNCKRINIGSNILLRYKQGNIELAMKTFY